MGVAYTAAIDNLNCPTVIVAWAKKGKGVADLEDIGGWHGKALKPDQAKAAIAQGDKSKLLNQDLRKIPLKLLFLRVLCASVVRFSVTCA